MIRSGLVVPVHLTVRQGRYAGRCIGISRAVYNIYVAASRMARTQLGRWPSGYELARELNKLKHDTEEFRFIAEVSKFVAEGARDNFRAAMDRWFRGEAGRPGFHARRATGSGSFLAASGADTIRYDGHRRLRLPYIGSVRLRHGLPGDAVVSKVTLKKLNGRWYASLGLRVPDKAQERKPQPSGGLDVGISPLAMESDGTEHENPRALRRSLGKLRRWQRAQSRRKPGSRGWYEAQRHIDSCQRRITGLRANAHHQLSRAVTRKYSVLGVETLNVSGMDNLRWQAQAIRDAAIGGLLRKVEYKCRWYGTELVQAPAFYPSSKTCYACGVVNAELRREPIWRCGVCGVTHERNLNAARNLQKLALGAVGPDVTRPDSKALVRLTTDETVGDEGRTGPLATVHPAAD